MDQPARQSSSGRLLRLLLGRRLANREQEQRQIGWVEAVPAMGLDALGSSSYGPEAALAALMPLGAAGAVWLGPVTGAIVVLLLLVYLSYRQTIRAYPTSAGGYVVARENLGRYPSLLAAAALMVDYVLNVAVGISAGVGALVSAVPALQPFILPLCLCILIIVTLAHLRGTGEAGWFFAIPTYLFIACFLGTIGWAVWQVAATAGHPQLVAPPPPVPAATGAASLWLLMHAFASGCTAMTGVEAVSNGVGSFRRPVERNALTTLTVIVAVLALLLGGVELAAAPYHVAAMDQTRPGYQSVMSQFVGAVAGRGPFYYVAMGSLLAVLCFSASTSFVGFPRVGQMVAADGYLPKAFAIPGRRLVYTAGILFLGGAAGLLLIAFGGITDRLIPLFAIGAFLTFTLSQSGMVIHWKKRGHGCRKLAVNALGALATAFALLLMLVAKFAEGAWITLIALPVVILVLRGIRRYYDELDRALHRPGEITLDHLVPPTVIVVAEDWNRHSERAVKFALTISPDVVAVHMSRLGGPDSDRWEPELRRRWAEDVEKPVAAAGLTPPRLMLLPAPYRRIQEPLFELIDRLDREAPERAVAVLIPQTIATSWWQTLLHTHRACRLRSALLRWGRPNLTVVTIPWRLEEESAGEAARNLRPARNPGASASP